MFHSISLKLFCVIFIISLVSSLLILRLLNLIWIINFLLKIIWVSEQDKIISRAY